MPRDDLIRMRRGTAAQWTSANPVLDSGELGVDLDTGKFKVGDASTVWTLLEYATDISNLPTSVITLNQSDAFSRVQMVSEPVPSVMDPKWGAKGDGTTGDSTAIQNAINDCSTIGVARNAPVPLRFPSGRSFLFNAIVVAKSYVDIDAHGAILARQAGAFNQQALFRSSMTSGDPPVTGFRLRGGVYLGANLEVGANAAVVRMTQATDCMVEDLFANNLNGAAVYFTDSQIIRVRNNNFQNIGGGAGTTNGINIVNDNLGTTLPTKDVWVQNNFVSSAHAQCIGLVTSTTANRTDPVWDAHVTNNTCVALPASTASPMYVENGSPTVNISTIDISGNTFICQGTAVRGVNFDNDGGSTDPLAVTGITCRGNRLINGGMLAGASNSLIEGNYIVAPGSTHDIQLDKHGAASPGLVGVTIKGNVGGFSSGDHINGTAGTTFDPTTCFFDSATGPKSQETWGTAAPTTGTWRVGAKCWNTTPPAAGTFMWVCTTAGTPGTWTAVTIP